MKQTVLEGREALKKEIDKIAEVAGYLWQNGWAERNGGNITVNITELVDDKIKSLSAISDVKQIGVTLPALKGCYFFCKGTGKRMRDLAREPMDNGSIIRILDDCASYVIIADNAVMPTSELPSHLTVHVGTGICQWTYKGYSACGFKWKKMVLILKQDKCFGSYTTCLCTMFGGIDFFGCTFSITVLVWVVEQT